MLEMPLFGQSDNHAMLQICDLLNSGIVFPVACETYCTGYVTSVHVSPEYAVLRTNFGARLRNLQYRYKDPASGFWQGGLKVVDPLGHKNVGRHTSISPTISVTPRSFCPGKLDRLLLSGASQDAGVHGLRQPHFGVGRCLFLCATTVS